MLGAARPPALLRCLQPRLAAWGQLCDRKRAISAQCGLAGGLAAGREGLTRGSAMSVACQELCPAWTWLMQQGVQVCVVWGPLDMVLRQAGCWQLAPRSSLLGVVPLGYTSGHQVPRAVVGCPPRPFRAPL